MFARYSGWTDGSGGRGCHPVKQQRRHRQPELRTSEDGRAAERGEEKGGRGGDERGEGCTRCSPHSRYWSLAMGLSACTGHTLTHLMASQSKWLQAQSACRTSKTNSVNCIWAKLTEPKKNVKHSEFAPNQPTISKHSSRLLAADVSELLSHPLPLIPPRIGSDQTCGNYRRCPRAEVKGRRSLGRRSPSRKRQELTFKV